jgi:hypothetical protein
MFVALCFCILFFSSLLGERIRERMPTGERIRKRSGE